MRFRDRVAIVTGGSRGIGAAFARRLAAEGAAVVINYRQRADEAEAVVSDITAAGGRAVAVAGDVGQQATADTLINAALTNFGRIDCVINNAGIAVRGRVDDVSVEQWVGVINTNLLGPFYLSKAALPHLRQTKGVILNISSINAQISDPGLSSYSASKAALEAFTKSLGKEEARHGVRVVCLSPGPTRTEMQIGGWTDEQVQRLAGIIPLQRLGEPDDVANAALFLLSDEAAYITATTLTVSGGLSGSR